MSKKTPSSCTQDSSKYYEYDQRMLKQKHWHLVNHGKQNWARCSWKGIVGKSSMISQRNESNLWICLQVKVIFEPQMQGNSDVNFPLRSHPVWWIRSGCWRQILDELYFCSICICMQFRYTQSNTEKKLLQIDCRGHINLRKYSVYSDKFSTPYMLKRSIQLDTNCSSAAFGDQLQR